MAMPMATLSKMERYFCSAWETSPWRRTPSKAEAAVLAKIPRPLTWPKVNDRCRWTAFTLSTPTGLPPTIMGMHTEEQMPSRGCKGWKRSSLTGPCRVRGCPCRMAQPAMPPATGTRLPRSVSRPSPRTVATYSSLPSRVGSMTEASSASHCSQAASATLFRIRFMSSV